MDLFYTVLIDFNFINWQQFDHNRFFRDHKHILNVIEQVFVFILYLIISCSLMIEMDSLNKSQPQQDSSNPENQDKLQGLVTQFISSDEITWRAPSIYEEYPFVQVAQYLRNTKYSPDRVRSPETLKKCTIYLIQKILPLLKNKQYKIKETIQFINDRMRAIRAEYHVQSSTDIQNLQKMLRYQCVASAYTNSHSEIIVVAKSLYQKYKLQPSKARPQFLKYILLLSGTMKDIDHTLWQFDSYFCNLDFLDYYIRICSSLKEQTFYSYFQFLKSCSFFEGCLLVPFLSKMRVSAIQAFAVSCLVIEINQLSKYLLFEVEELVVFLQKLGYELGDQKKAIERKEEVNINLKMKLKMFKQLEETTVRIPQQIILKLGVKSQIEAILEQL